MNIIRKFLSGEKRQKSVAPVATATISGGYLVLSSPASVTAVIWRKQIKDLDDLTFAIEKGTKNEQKGHYILLSKSKDKITEIAVFDAKDKADQAFQTVTQALFSALDTQDINEKGVTMTEQPKKSAGRPPLWISFLIWGTAVLVMYLIIGWFMEERPAPSVEQTQTEQQEEIRVYSDRPKDGDLIAPPSEISSDVPQGVPVVLDDLLKE